MSKAGQWSERAIDTIRQVADTQMDAIGETARRCAEAIAAGGMAHLFGTGHSRIPIEEMFPRYGSFPGFHPMAELSMTFHTQVAGVNGQRQAMFIERTEGLAEVILSNFQFSETDVMIVFSSGGVSAVPIEMAMGARERGLFVVAVTSVEHSRQSESLHSSSTRLLDHADVVIDTCTPVGDAAIYFDGVDTPVGPLTTIATTAIVNEIKVQTAEILIGNGIVPPVLTSSAIVGKARSQETFDQAFADHAGRVARALTGEHSS